jgi:methionyl aminopeptidase
MHKITIKTPEELRIMAEGGKKLAVIKNELAAAVRPGIATMDLEKIADRLIGETGGKASFKMVPGYKHATCININEVVVHGIPDSRIIKEGDIVGIDVGLYYKGFHSDTSVTVAAGKAAPDVIRFLETGKRALKTAIAAAKPGKRVADISKAMQDGVENAGYSAVRALTGHGIGRELHEEPAIPCFILGKKEFTPKLVEGMAIAIEVMYNAGTSEVGYVNDDGWTIATMDGKISGLFEETVAITKDGPVVLTEV